MITKKETPDLLAQEPGRERLAHQPGTLTISEADTPHQPDGAHFAVTPPGGPAEIAAVRYDLLAILHRLMRAGPQGVRPLKLPEEFAAAIADLRAAGVPVIEERGRYRLAADVAEVRT